MKKVFFIGFCLLWGALDVLAQPGKTPEEPKVYILGGLNVEGAQFSDPGTIMNLSGLVVGDPVRVPGNSLSDALKRLWKENIFSDIKIRQDNLVGNKIYLTLEVTERPRISQFTFKGITKAKADELREKINFIRGTILTESKIQSAKRVIRNYYVEKGFYNTTVDITSAPDPTFRNGVLVEIDIKRGDKVKIQQINIEGNEDFSDKKLVSKLKGMRDKRSLKFWVATKYVPKKYKEAKENLMNFYNENGYRDALVEFDTVYTHSGNRVNIDMKIYEGNKFYYRNLDWVGNYKYNSEELSRILALKRGDIYNPEKLQKRLSGDPNGGDVSTYYMDDGYLFFQIDPVEVAVTDDSIDLEIRIVEGPQATIRKVIVEGNTKTSDYVILRMLRTQPGHKFSRSDIIRSQREILNLGYFDQEKINVVPIPDYESGTVDIKYIVEERPSDQLQLQGGWGGRIVDNQGRTLAGGFVGTVQLGFNNFSTRRLFRPMSEWGGPVPSGDGQRLSLAIQMNGSGFQNYSINFLEPWLGGKKPNSFGVNASYFVFQNFGTRDVFRNRIANIGIDYGRRLKFPDDFFRSFNSITYKYYDTKNPGNFFGQQAFTRADGTPETEAFVNVFALRQSFERNSVDAPIYPKSGSIMSFYVEATPPYSMFRKNVDYAELSPSERFKFLEYHKWRFNSNWFWRLFGNVVLNARVDAGFVGRYDPVIGISPFERFQLGGAGLVMNNFAFAGREIVPLRGYKDNSLDNNGNGFTIFNRYVAELRVPLTLNQSAPIWLLGFAEAGNGFTNFRNYNPFDLKRSLGVGMRVMLPMVGLLGLDAAYGFDDRTTIGGRQFHFIIGQQF